MVCSRRCLRIWQSAPPSLSLSGPGVQKFDPAGEGMPGLLRQLVLSGGTALWLLLLAKWLSRRLLPLV